MHNVVELNLLIYVGQEYNSDNEYIAGGFIYALYNNFSR